MRISDWSSDVCSSDLALLAGLLIAETEYHREVEVITAPFKGLALGVFLITVGMSLDVRIIAANWVSITADVIAVVLVKVVVTTTFIRISGARRSTALEVCVLMDSPLETQLIVMSADTGTHLILNSSAALWTLFTVLS